MTAKKDNVVSLEDAKTAKLHLPWTRSVMTSPTGSMPSVSA